MKHIAILVPEGAILGSVEGPRQLFSQVNTFFREQSKRPFFRIQLVGLAPEVRLSNGLFTVHTDVLLSDVARPDLIIIPAVDGDMQQARAGNQPFIPWIRQQHTNGAEVASLCLGAFLLASTGLLAGRKCTTHWLAANTFRQLFPDVALTAEKAITDEGGLYSSGGAYSYLSLILYLIEKYVSRDMAILCAKVFAIEPERDSQSPFIIFQGQKAHEDEPIRKAQEYIEQNVASKITVDELADTFALGRRNLERRFKKATSNTIAEYIQRVKIEAAKRGFETSRKNINEVMDEVGYSDPKAFRGVFRKMTGLTPVEYRNRYNKELAML